MTTTNEYETTLEQRAAFYTADEWKRILRVYARGDFEDFPNRNEPVENELYRRCREKFEKLENDRFYANRDSGVDPDTDYALPESEHGFLPAALHAMGFPAFRRAMLPFVKQFRDYADAMETNHDYPHDVGAFRGVIDGIEEWCDGVGDAYTGWVMLGEAMDFSGDPSCGWDSFDDNDDPLCDAFFAFRQVVFNQIDDNEGGGGPRKSRPRDPAPREASRDTNLLNI
jgi:hypothetical protein